MRKKSVFGLKLFRMSNELFGRADLAAAVACIGIAKEKIRRERNLVLKLSAQNVINRNAPFFPDDIETRKFQCGEYLSSVVVKRRRRVRYLEPHFFEPRRIVPDQ